VSGHFGRSTFGALGGSRSRSASLDGMDRTRDRRVRSLPEKRPGTGDGTAASRRRWTSSRVSRKTTSGRAWPMIGARSRCVTGAAARADLAASSGPRRSSGRLHGPVQRSAGFVAASRASALHDRGSHKGIHRRLWSRPSIWRVTWGTAVPWDRPRTICDDDWRRVRGCD
jgi:hypothetical protein